jgi:UDPglucose 6-dehydrogenase
LTKYITNTFLAVKVAYANEIATIAELFALDYNKLVNIFTTDERLGASHWHVPGPDGKNGFGGSCFPKDINALIVFAKKNKIKVPLLENAWKRNIEIDRKEKDWEQLIGRAITKKG